MTTQYWITGTSGDWATGADWLSGVSPKSTDDAVINNSNAVTVNGTAVANSLTLNNSEVVVSGTLTLGTSLTLESGTSQAELALNGGSFSAQSVVSANGEGVIGGYGTLNSAVSGYVLIYATGGGTLKVEGSLAGDSGYCFITSNATLELVNGTSQLVQFGGGTLKLDAPTAFTGQIQDIAIGDTIDLAGITASSATYSGTTLTINETNGQQLTYNNVSGSVAGDIVTVASDNNGGTLVYWTTAPVTDSWNSGTTGDWSQGADWSLGVVPTSTTDAVINNADGSADVTVNGTAVANSLTLNNSEVVVSGTLTLGTSLTLESGTSQAELALNGGSFSAQSVVSANGEGVIGGYGTLNSAVSGYVLIYATGGGTLKVEGSLAGDSGYCFITSNATLELVNGTSQLVQFGGGTLKLDAPTAFTGQIQDIAIGDTIDLAGITASSATYSGTTLTINETNGQQLTYNNVSGSVAGDIVTVASDNNGGTLVYWAQPQPPTVTSISATTDNQAADLNAGHLVTITMTTSGPVTVTGTPTLQLNDNEVATYTTGSSSNTLTFTYKVQPGDNVADLEVTGINLPPGVSIEDQATNALSGSVASDLSIQIDTTPPAVTERLFSDTGSSSTDKITSNDELIGSGDPNAVVHFTMDGKLISATATANSSGIWTFTPSGLADGVHTIVASETDAAGNTGTASLTFTLDTTAPVPVITSEVLSSGKVTLTGTTAEANDAIAVYDGATLIGTTTTASNGTWSFTTAKVSNVVHTYTATATDVAGNVGHSSNEAILGSAKAATLVGTPGNDIIIGNGGNDTITGGLGADTLTGGSGLFIIQSRIPHQAATTR